MALKNDLEMLIKYPMVLPKKHSNSEYCGYVKVDEMEYEVNFKVKNNKYTMEQTDDLKDFFNKIEELTEKEFSSTVDFLNELTSVIKLNTKKEDPKVPVDIYRKVLRGYYELRQFYINIHFAKLSKDLTTIDVIHSDEKNRKHPIVIKVDYSTNDKVFIISKCDLPDHQKSLISKPESSLLEIYDNFLKVVNNPSLQLLFDVLDNIDKNCWVLEPEKPMRKDIYRRIMLDDQVSVMINFDSKCVGTIPQIKFLGPAILTKRYTELLNKNCVNYDPNGDVILELYNLFEIKHFPRQPQDVLEEELLVNDGDCSICFSKWLKGKVPEIICDNSSCRHNYHSECLYQWLRQSSSKVFFFEVYGDCPNCEKKIRCPFPTEEKE